MKMTLRNVQDFDFLIYSGTMLYSPITHHIDYQGTWGLTYLV